MLELLQHGVAGAVKDDLVADNDEDAGGQGQQGRFVGDDDHGFAGLGLLGKLLQAAFFLFVVHGGGGFVKQVDGGLAQGQAGEGEQLLLPAAEAFAAFKDGTGQAFGVAGHKAVHAGGAHGAKQGFVAGVGQTNEQVVAQGALEQPVVLLQVAHLLVDDLAVYVAEASSVPVSLPCRRSHVVPFQRRALAPTIGAVGFAAPSPSAAAVGSSVSAWTANVPPLSTVSDAPPSPIWSLPLRSNHAWTASPSALTAEGADALA